MQFEATEGFRVERSPKFGGTIIGIKDIDHTRWTGSEWRCIKVKWDSEEEAAICPNRVSPWSIQVVEIYQRKRKSIPQDAKKARPFNPLFPFSVKGGKPDNGLVSGLTKNSVEHIHHGHSGILQGQEFGIVGAYNQRTSARLPVSHLSLKPFSGRGEKQFGLDTHQLQIHDHHESTISIPGDISTTLGIVISGSPTSASRATNYANGAKKCLSILDVDLITSKSQKKCISEAPHEVQPADSGTCMIFGVNVLGNHPRVPLPQCVVDSELNCFDVVPTPLASQEGISKTIHVQERSNDNLQDELCSCLHINRSCKKVVKYGTALGKSIDLPHFNGYGDLISELDKIFEFNGALIDMSSNWRLSYTDGERDRMFGDCP
ncbi:Auxin response factor 2 [Abeliophyllum distichum]|uniref:Auxin response factor 2 n=1 Tax=Abeliophyllum distichum TaxID=126358 RepID=A0ABD1RD53_9LAMI